MMGRETKDDQHIQRNSQHQNNNIGFEQCEILAVVQPGYFGKIMCRSQKSIGKQQQLKRQAKGGRYRKQHEENVQVINPVR